MTKIIGITGGYGSGKSTLTKYLKKKKFTLHDSDKEVHKLYKNPNADFKKHLLSLGLITSLKTKQINKKEIAEKIFSNKNLRKKLETFVHSKLSRIRKRFINKNKKLKTKIIFLDIPLLFEKNLDKEFDKIICVLCSKKTRIQRLKLQKKTKKTMFEKIVMTQTSDVQRKKRSDFCITNNKTKKIFFRKVDEVLILI